ncbi:MAG: glycosyltransferase [Bacteroidota bacterium]
MKILIILSRVPYPLDKGDKLRAFYQIKYLSKQHDIILFCLNDERKVPKENIEVLKQFCKKIEIVNLTWISIIFNVLRAFFKGLPLQTGYFYSSKAKKRFLKLFEKENPDRLYCQMIRTTEYCKEITTNTTLDYQDALSKGAERRIDNSNFFLKCILNIEHKRLLKYERIVFDRFANKIIISETDRDFIFHPQNKDIFVVPNGVDIDYFSAKPSVKKHSILFTGNMGYPPNIDASCFLAKEIFPKVMERIPNANLLISGTQPAFQVVQLQNENVTVSGWVDDIKDSYSTSSVFVAPMLNGSGLQNKLLEAMAMNLPCVTTSLANNALGAKDGKQILIANTAQEFANCIIDLLLNREKANTIASEGHEFVKCNYNWDSINAKLEDIICS